MTAIADLVAEEHIAVRGRTFALLVAVGMGNTRRSGQKRNGCNEGGKKAFHGDSWDSQR